MKNLFFFFITIFLCLNPTNAHEEWTGQHIEDVLFELSYYSGKQVHAVGYFMLSSDISKRQAAIYDKSLEDNKVIYAELLLQDTKFKTIYKYCETVMQTEYNGKMYGEFIPCGVGMFHLNMNKALNWGHSINHIVFKLSDGSPKHF